MLEYTEGNLLDSEAEALVNTVNTVGVMGKGIALMFKEAFPQNYKQYLQVCKDNQLDVGHVFVTRNSDLLGPKWIINFPTKRHWRDGTQPEWIRTGLQDLKYEIEKRGIKSIAIPPLGCGNGGLDWALVKNIVEEELDDLGDVQVIVYQPTEKYQNVAKKKGVDKLTPARALVSDLVRRYWALGIDCSILEIQKLAWFLETRIRDAGIDDPLDLRFSANKYGPYAHRLQHLLNSLDGSYLHCSRRLADAGPMDVIWFDSDKKQYVNAYLQSGEAKRFQPVLEQVGSLIDGFQSPFGLELLATVDWLVREEKVTPECDSVIDALRSWPGGKQASERKCNMFSRRHIDSALDRLRATALAG